MSCYNGRQRHIGCFKYKAERRWRKIATIKDVARLAGVSSGSVSNVLNGKTQNAELIKQVEEAMDSLKYYPDANARSLKNTKTNILGLILPDASRYQYSKFIMLLEQSLREKSYSLLVKFSRNNWLQEKKAVESFLKQRVDGIIIWSALPQEKNESIVNSRIPMLVISSNESDGSGSDRVVLEYSGAFCSLLEDLKRRGLSKVGLITEREFHMKDFADKYSCNGFQNPPEIYIADGTEEGGFKAAFEMASAAEGVDAVVAGSYEIGKGVVKALRMLPDRDIQVFVNKEANWLDDTDNFAGVIEIPLKTVVKESLDRILEAIQFPQLHEKLVCHVPACYKEIPSDKKDIIHSKNELRFAMYNCSSARSLKMLSRIYEKKSGIKIHFDMYSYSQLEELLFSEAGNRSTAYDGFMMDITWFNSLAETGMVKNLDALKARHCSYFDGFIGGAVDDYSLYNGSVYSIPFMPGAQLMFYQRDLFEDKALDIKYQRMYGLELKPPRNWSQFNAVAEFFTRKYNPGSPVKYGVSMASGVNAYTTSEFLSRLWAYGGSVFDSFGNPSICSRSAIDALVNLRQAYNYCSGRELHSWDECADDFSRGDCAMVLLYTSDAGSINDYTKSRVAGNLGYSLVPGGVSVMGGWSVGLNRYAVHQEEAENFLLWACSDQNCLPLSILGGSTMRREYYEHSDLENLEPWKELVLESARGSRKRYIPYEIDRGRIKNTVYSSIIPNEISNYMNDMISAEEAVCNMEEGIMALIESNRNFGK
ncbi:MAG: extracellular solute-binding protein [Candidatus Limivicinus sp.]